MTYLLKTTIAATLLVLGTFAPLPATDGAAQAQCACYGCATSC